MSIASTVHDLSQQLRRQLQAQHDDAEINHWLDLIGSMTEYSTRLHEWESTVQHFSFLNEAVVEQELKYQLALEIFEFGRFNMYGKFDLPNTLAEYEKLNVLLKQKGLHSIPALGDVNLSTWF